MRNGRMLTRGTSTQRRKSEAQSRGVSMYEASSADQASLPCSMRGLPSRTTTTDKGLSLSRLHVAVAAVRAVPSA